MKTTLNIELKKQLKEIFDEKTGTLKKKYSEEITRCPVCESNSSTIHYVKDGFIHKRCQECSMIYLSPRLTVEATHDFYNSVVNEVYNEDKFHDDSSENMDDRLNLNNYSILQKYVNEKKGLKLLEIGPGRGALLKKAKSDGFNTTAIELNQKLIDNLRKICDHVFTEDITKLDIEENTYDIIYFRDVMEHVPDPKTFLRHVHKVLKKDGILFIDTHNIDALIYKLTKEYHTVIFGFEHPLHWSPKTLKIACESVGLTHLKTYYQEIDLSLYRLLNYYNFPSFTYINPPKRNKYIRSISIFIQKILGLKILKSIDTFILRKVANSTNNGSKMQVIFTKKDG